MRSPLRAALIPVLAVAALTMLAACEKDETAPENHEPASVRLYNATTTAELTPNVQLPAGATTRVQVAFFAADGDSIMLPADHFTKLTFTPGTFATVADVAGQRFHRDVAVTATAGAMAQLTVGYGHDVDADEHTFGPFTVTAGP